MIKYMKYLLALVLFSLDGIAMEETPTEFSIGMTGKSTHFTFRSVREGDTEAIQKIASESESMPGFPKDPVAWTKNHIARQKGGNPYSLLVLEDETGGIVGALGFGIMTVLNYDPKFTDIIDTYVELGVTRFKNSDAEDKYAKDNIERVDNRGLGFILPMLPPLGAEKIQEALKLSINTYNWLKKAGVPSPRDGSVPVHLIGLFNPDGYLVPCLEAVGFNILKKDGFFGYYDMPCVVAQIELK